jgi:hypothetical protein
MHQLFDLDHERLLLTQLELADSFWSRGRGLLGRRSIAPNAGLWIPGTSSLHMIGMRFPISVLWLSHPDHEGMRSVLKVELLRPWLGLGFGPRGGDGALEAHPDLVGQVTVGTRVRIEPAT